MSKVGNASSLSFKLRPKSRSKAKAKANELEVNKHATRLPAATLKQQSNN